MFTYKGYISRIFYDEADGLFRGKVINVLDELLFWGDSIDELQNAFEEAVERYLDSRDGEAEFFCDPATGRMVFRTSSEKLSAITQAAANSGKTVNEWVDETLSSALSDSMVKSNPLIG